MFVNSVVNDLFLFLTLFRPTLHCVRLLLAPILILLFTNHWYVGHDAVTHNVVNSTNHWYVGHDAVTHNVVNSTK